MKLAQNLAQTGKVLSSQKSSVRLEEAFSRSAKGILI
jgi:hypothetical protein